MMEEVQEKDSGAGIAVSCVNVRKEMDVDRAFYGIPFTCKCALRAFTHIA